MTEEERRAIFEGRVNRRSKTLEYLLEQNYQAVGNGLGSKARNVEHKLDRYTFKKLTFISSVRNQLAHDVTYEYDGDEDDFLSTCDEIIRRLSNPSSQGGTHAPPPRDNTTTTDSSSRSSSYNSYQSSNSYSYSHPASSSHASSGSSTSASKSRSSIDVIPFFKFVVKASLVAATVVAVLVVGSKILSSIQSGEGRAVWTMMGVNTDNLNVRSGPGANSSRIA